MSIKKYNKPDLNAPRYRPTKLNLTNNESYKRFISENPKYSKLTLEEFKTIISTFNGKIWETAISERDGIELPEQLGYIFIGTCPRRKRSSLDYKKSETYNTQVRNQNWESDNYVAKIFYTSFETKYRFRNNEMWGFEALRDFKRTVAHTYPLEWKKYVVVDNFMKISRLFRKETYKDVRKKRVEEMLKDYNEFNLD